MLDAIAAAVLRSGWRHDGRTDERTNEGEPRTRNSGEEGKGRKSGKRERDGRQRTAGAFRGRF